MKMSLADQKKYPKLARYVRKSMPTVMNVPVIVRNLKTYGSLSKEDAKEALTWGKGPTIIIKDLKTNKCGKANAAYGCFRSSNKDQIELAKRFADQFEVNMAKGKDNKNKAGKRVYIVGATLLHELCHWGNKKAGVKEKTEQGLAFETATYGKTIW